MYSPCKREAAAEENVGVGGAMPYWLDGLAEEGGGGDSLGSAGCWNTFMRASLALIFPLPSSLGEPGGLGDLGEIV